MNILSFKCNSTHNKLLHDTNMVCYLHRQNMSSYQSYLPDINWQAFLPTHQARRLGVALTEVILAPSLRASTSEASSETTLELQDFASVEFSWLMREWRTRSSIGLSEIPGILAPTSCDIAIGELGLLTMSSWRMSPSRDRMLNAVLDKTLE